jgi:tetratricopeptide (TPR) repeat protein
MPSVDPAVMEQHARRLELRMAVVRLFGVLFPASPPDPAPGRYALLQQFLERSPALLGALVDAHPPARTRELWSEALVDGEIDVRLLHALAVVFREHALVAQAGGGRARHVDAAGLSAIWTFSTGLWVLLLATDGFWDWFGESRFTSREGARRTLESAERDELMMSAARHILGLHGTTGARELAAGRRDIAGVHARCLDLCRSRNRAVIEALEDLDLVYPLEPDAARLRQIGGVADEVLDTWAQSLVRDAEREVDDPEVAKTLPEGIRKNFEGGIRRLETFTALGVAVPRVLRSALDWYNQWCHCLYTTGKTDEIKRIMQPARKLADQLAPLCERKRGFDPYNQVLSTHYLLRGFVAGEPVTAQREFDEALAWNPGNDNAQQLRRGSRRQHVQTEIDKAIELVKQKNFKRAYSALDAVADPDDPETKDALQQARSVVCFRDAMEQAEHGHYRAALERARESARLNPGEQAIRQLVAQLEEAAPEEHNMRHMHAAREAMDAEKLDEAIAHAARVDRTSKYAAFARNLQSAAHFRRGIAAAGREKFDDAVADLKQALSLNENAGERTIIQQQLTTLEQAQIGAGLKRAFDSRNWSSAEAHLRRALQQPGLSGKVKKTLQGQLSMVLNAHAVELANSAQKARQEGADDLMGTFEAYKKEKGLDDFSVAGMDWSDLQAFMARRRGQGFTAQVDAASYKQRAIGMLEEAIKLDSSNSTAKENLKAIKNM